MTDKRSVGRPPGSTKNPDLEIVKEQNAWLSRLRRSGSIVDQLLEGLASDLSNAGLSREGRLEIMTAIKDAVAMQVKVVAECQRMREKNPPAQSSAGELDLT